MATKLNSDILPWERQVGESAKAFEAFCIYRDLREERRVVKVARQLSKSQTLIQRWKKDHNWEERVIAFDRETDRIAIEQQRKDIAKMRKNHAALASAMLVKSAKALNNLKDEDIKPADISKMVDVASKLERISRGDIGEVIEQRDGGKSEASVTFYIPENNRDNQEEG